MSENDEKKCMVCGATEDLIEKQVPGIGVTGGIYICKEHDEEMNAMLEKSAKRKQSRRARDDSQS